MRHTTSVAATYTARHGENAALSNLCTITNFAVPLVGLLCLLDFDQCSCAVKAAATYCKLDSHRYVRLQPPSFAKNHHLRLYTTEIIELGCCLYSATVL